MARLELWNEAGVLRRRAGLFSYGVGRAAAVIEPEAAVDELVVRRLSRGLEVEAGGR